MASFTLGRQARCVLAIAALLFLVGCFTLGATALAASLSMSEWQKQHFIRHLATSCGPVMDVDCGDLSRPLAFSIAGTRVSAVLRGKTELWHLERFDRRIVSPPLCIVQRGWPLNERPGLVVEDLTPRLLCLWPEGMNVHGALITRARTDLVMIMGRETRRLEVGSGRVFLEIDRRGLGLPELKEMMARLDDVVAVVSGGAPRLPSSTCTEAAVAGPMGVPVPALA